MIAAMTIKTLSRFLFNCAAAAMAVGSVAGQALTTLQKCKLIPMEWADGDSFLIQAQDGASHTIRLYGTDCIEWHVSDESVARRLRAQRRYFGMSEFGGGSPSVD